MARQRRQGPSTVSRQARMDNQLAANSLPTHASFGVALKLRLGMEFSHSSKSLTQSVVFGRLSGNSDSRSQVSNAYAESVRESRPQFACMLVSTPATHPLRFPSDLPIAVQRNGKWFLSHSAQQNGVPHEHTDTRPRYPHLFSTHCGWLVSGALPITSLTGDPEISALMYRHCCRRFSSGKLKL